MSRVFLTSDAHFSHYDENTKRGIITFERTKFKDIQEHDDYLQEKWTKWSEQVKEGDDFWFLGDFGNLSYLWLFKLFSERGCRTHFLMGNHDSVNDIPIIEQYVDEVHQYPVYLSHKLVFSHEPVPTWGGILNVHGHLHGAVLDSPNYLNASVHVANYKLINTKHISTAFGKLPKWSTRFLYEPYADMYKFTQPKEDVIMDKNGKVDLSASRTLMRLSKKKRIAANDFSYVPYTGEG